MDLALDVSHGNVDLLQLGSELRLQYAVLGEPTRTSSATLTPSSPSRERDLRDLFFVVGDLNVGRKAGDSFLNNGFGHARWTHMWLRFFGTEVFGQLQFDEFIRLKRRLLGGVGVRLEPVASSTVGVALGLGYMVEYERLEDLPSPPQVQREPSPETVAQRLTSYASIRLSLGRPDVRLINTLYVQPRFSDPGDYRVLDEAEFEFSLGVALKLVVGASSRFDSRPPDGVENFDVALKHKLRVAF